MGRNLPLMYTSAGKQFKRSKSTPPLRLRMYASSTYLPKYDPLNPQGEDSHFINLSAKTIGIADGSGGWETRSGVEAGQYARRLMRNSEYAVRKAIGQKEDLYKKLIPIVENNILPGSSRIIMKITSKIAAVYNAIRMGDIHPKKIRAKAQSQAAGRRSSTIALCKAIQEEDDIHPKTILMEAYSKTRVPGSSTACLITICDNNILRAVNVGDSGFVIVRDGRIVYRSPIQQHSFNNPYLLRMGNPNNDTTLAMELQVKVESGDVIIAGTDGLFYNMHEAQLEDVMRESKKLGLSPEKTCYLIAHLARRNSFDTRAKTPFSTAVRAAGYAHSGGKIDDITVVVAVIRPCERI